MNIDRLIYGSDPNKQNPQDEFNISVLNSVRELGIIEPIVVLNLPQGLTVRTGNVCVWAARQCGIKEVDCIVVTLERDIGSVPVIKGRKVTNIESEFKYPIVWNEDKNMLTMKTTHFHLGHKGVV